MVKKKRCPGHKGEKSSSAKLTDKYVREAHILRRFRYTIKDISIIYNVSEGAIWFALNGWSWKHIYREFNNDRGK